MNKIKPKDRTADFIALARAVFSTPFDAILALKTETQIIFVDGHQSPPAITATAPKDDPDCLWEASAATFKRVLDGERGLTNAFVSGRLSITGDIAVLARIELTQ